MKRLQIITIFLVLGFLFIVGCNNTTTPPVTPTVTETASITVTETPASTETPIEERGTLQSATFFEVQRGETINISSNYALELTFDVDLDLDSLVNSDATKYILIFCNKEKKTAWEGTVYVNSNFPNKMIIQFEGSTNITCDINDLEIVPIKAAIKVKGGGYIKGIEEDTENLPENESPAIHGGMKPNFTGPHEAFSPNSPGNWYKPHYVPPVATTTPPPVGGVPTVTVTPVPQPTSTVPHPHL